MCKSSAVRCFEEKCRFLLYFRYYLMGMVSSQLEILGNRLENLGTEIIKDDAGPDICNENSNKLKLCIKEHQNIIE